jgi:hypothetical protein
MFAHPHPCSIIISITSPYRSVEWQIFNITTKLYYYIAPFKIYEPVEQAFPLSYAPWLCDIPVTKQHGYKNCT